MIAYWHPNVVAAEAKEHPAFARLRYAGPWHYKTHPQGGVIAAWRDCPEAGKDASLDARDYGTPEDCGDGLRYLPPKVKPSLYDLVWGEKGGIDVPLACGLTVTVPPALTSHRAVRLSARKRALPPIGELGALAYELLDAAGGGAGIAFADPRLQRALCLAIGQRYRSTPELLEDLGVLAEEDVDPLLGALWFGDPKALKPAADAAGSPSPSSDSTATP